MNAPRLISRYEVKGLIARGGMGDLYLARDPNTNRLVVVKLLSATLESSDIRERFEREARALASLSHPNIVQIYDYGELDDTPFIVIEYVRGETLGERIKRRAPMPVALKLKLLAELCGGLDHAHAAGIIHRDVKPGNLMVDQDERLKILDFGIARVADSSLTRFGVLASQLVMQIGTPGYMSPEQVQGAEIDARSDVFAAGAVCYALLAYRDPFAGKNPDEIERNVMMSSPVPLTSLVPDLDPDVVSIVTRALAKSREQRYPDAATMGAALERCRQRLSQSEIESRPAVQPKAGSPAETAYQRALALYEQGSREAARRFSVEALAEDPNHAGARALLTRVQSERRAAATSMRPPTQAAAVPSTAALSRTPTTDDPTAPTVHIPAVQRPEVPDLSPTILMKPGERPRQPPATDATIRIPPQNRPPAPADTRTKVRATAPEAPRTDPFAAPGRVPETTRAVPVDPDAFFGPADRNAALGAEETILIPPKPAARDNLEKNKGTTPPIKKPVRPAADSPWARLTSAVAAWRARGSPPPSGRRPTGAGRVEQPLWKQYGLSVAVAAGLLIAVGVVAVFVLWLAGPPSGYVLTVTRPQGGTILGPGLRCGTDGSDCQLTLEPGAPVELAVKADSGFVFGAYTGDCAPAGRMLMTQARTCGATFNPEQVATFTKTWTLTVRKPIRGTLIAAGGINCGTMGDACSAEYDDGRQVVVEARPDTGFERSAFLDDCAQPVLIMTGPRSCGATFVERGRGGSGPRAEGPKPAPAPPSPRPEPPVVPPPVIPSTGPATVPVVAGPGEVKAPPTPDEYAKAIGIPELLNKYCPAQESRDPLRVQAIYPTADMAGLKRAFSGYRSVKCEMSEQGKWKYVQLDGAKGIAHVQVEVKQTNEGYRIGGAPEVNETIADFFLTRPTERADWQVAKLAHKPKPKS
jgi:serine/threonine-protein kinase